MKKKTHICSPELVLGTDVSTGDENSNDETSSPNKAHKKKKQRNGFFIGARNSIEKEKVDGYHSGTKANKQVRFLINRIVKPQKANKISFPATKRNRTKPFPMLPRTVIAKQHRSKKKRETTDTGTRMANDKAANCVKETLVSSAVNGIITTHNGKHHTRCKESSQKKETIDFCQNLNLGTHGQCVVGERGVEKRSFQTVKENGTSSKMQKSYLETEASVACAIDMAFTNDIHPEKDKDNEASGSVSLFPMSTFGCPKEGGSFSGYNRNFPLHATAPSVPPPDISEDLQELLENLKDFAPEAGNKRHKFFSSHPGIMELLSEVDAKSKMLLPDKRKKVYQYLSAQLRFSVNTLKRKIRNFRLLESLGEKYA